MTKKWLIAVLLLPSIYVGAQSIRLSRYNAPNALYLNIDQLYNFNMYERSSFSLGLTWVSPNQYATQEKKVLGQWSISPYISYGTKDHGFKYGIGTLLRLPGKYDVKLSLLAYNDLERAASRSITWYRMLEPSSNNGMVTSRFVGVKGAVFEFAFSPRRAWEIQLGVRQTWEDYRFDNNGSLYPLIDASSKAETRMFSEIRGRVNWLDKALFTLYAGRVAAPASERQYYLRLLAQYDAKLGNTGLSLFAQVGGATHNAPYSRMFDLSGTAYSMYFFKKSFLTVRPNTFTSNIFTHICLNYTAPLPLWKLSWSAPHPFLQINAMWGHLLGQDEEGHRVWDGLSLQAPNKGLLEPATGFDRIIHWGLMDIGFGVAYQICPTAAVYLNDEISDNIAIFFVADFILDHK